MAQSSQYTKVTTEHHSVNQLPFKIVGPFFPKREGALWRAPNNFTEEKAAGGLGLDWLGLVSIS